MRSTLLVLCLFLVTATGIAEDRFGRPVVKVKDPKDYQFTKLDDVEYPSLTNANYTVSCLAYRGAEHYYVEISVKNNSKEPVLLPTSFVTFDKPGYSVYRGDTMMAAREAASMAGVRFTPTPPPYVPPTYNTTVNGTATSYGNQTNISGTATTTADTSGQAGANFGNAIGNAIAARRFYKLQRIQIAFSSFLASHVQTDADMSLQPGQSRTVVAIFDESKPKKRDFEITIKIGDDTFPFTYKE